MAARRKSVQLPAFIAPMLAKPGAPFDSPEHLFEIKWDGTRTLAFVERDGYRLVNRRRVDMTERYPEFAFLGKLPPGTVLDGEMVVLHNGKPDFPLLLSREQSRSPRKIQSLARTLPATLVVFDQIYEDYQPLLTKPLSQRREHLAKLVERCGDPHLVLSQGVVGNGVAFFEGACAQGLEGAVAKRLSSPYQPGQRTGAWIKIKRSETVQCAIVGFLPSGKNDFRSLILAAQEGDKLRYVGKVGTGFNRALRDRLNRLLWARLRDRPLVPCKVRGNWVEPGLYCTVRCMERTAGGELRAPAFGELIVEGEHG